MTLLSPTVRLTASPRSESDRAVAELERFGVHEENFAADDGEVGEVRLDEGPREEARQESRDGKVEQARHHQPAHRREVGGLFGGDDASARAPLLAKRFVDALVEELVFLDDDSIAQGDPSSSKLVRRDS